MRRISKRFQQQAREEQAKLAEHTRKRKYGSFVLTDAIRPSFALDIIPEEGYRIDDLKDVGNDKKLLYASISREKLFKIFLQFLDECENEVEVFLEQVDPRHRHATEEHYSELLDVSLVRDVCIKHKSLLLNQGYLSIVIRDARGDITLDRFKCLGVIHPDINTFERILWLSDVDFIPDIQFLSEGPHIGLAYPEFNQAFENLRYALCGEKPEPTAKLG